MKACDVCSGGGGDYVVAVPGVPCSMAYCLPCLNANAHPWGILVANTACLGGLVNAAEWWRAMVDDTCKRLGKTLDQFNADVAASMAQLP